MIASVSTAYENLKKHLTQLKEIKQEEKKFDLEELCLAPTNGLITIVSKRRLRIRFRHRAQVSSTKGFETSKHNARAPALSCVAKGRCALQN